MSEQEKLIGKRQCFISGCVLVLSLLLIGATGMNSGLKKEYDGSFLLNSCRAASAGFAEKTAPCFREGFQKLAAEDPEFMLRLNCTDLR